MHVDRSRGRPGCYNGPQNAFDLPALLEQLDASRPDFSHFFATETLSLTVASWPAGSTDGQTPHAEDEVYFVAAGRGVISVAGSDRAVGPGAIVFVAAGVEHHSTRSPRISTCSCSGRRPGPRLEA